MKKLFLGVLTTVLVFTIHTTTAFAAGCGHHYADSSCDNVCDYAESDCRYVDEDMDGVCDNCCLAIESCGCQGSCLVGTNGSGVCDPYAADACTQRTRGRRTSGHRGHHR